MTPGLKKGDDDEDSDDEDSDAESAQPSAAPHAGGRLAKHVQIPGLVDKVLQFIATNSLATDVRRRESVDIVRTGGGTGFEDMPVPALTAIEDVAERYLLRFRKSSMLIDDDKVISQPKV